MNTQLLTTPGDNTSTPAAGYSVNTTYIGFGAGNHVYRITVTLPGFVPTPAFDGQYDYSLGHTDHQVAQQMAEHHAKGLVELIEMEANGIADERIAEVAAGVDATMKQAEVAHLAPRQADRKAADDLVWTRNQRCLDAYVQGRPNQKPKPRTRPRPLSVLTATILAEADEHGHIRKGDGVTETMLRHLERCGLGVIKLGGPGRRRFEVDRLELNADGMAAAAEAKLAVSR